MEQLLLEEIKKLALPLLSSEGVELVELLLRREGARLLLRFLVDRPQGVTLDECTQLNRAISRILDQENIIQQSYVLEVCSPGLDRPLKSTRDFQRNLGKLIKLALHLPIQRQNVWIGALDGVDEETITIHTEKGERLQIARKDIAWAKQEIQV